MDSLYLLLPLSVLLVLGLIGLFAWALDAGQFEDLEREGWRAIEGAACDAVDPGQGPDTPAFRQ
jgi:cbb3-type cytochrome oxidase maturation protein